MKKCLIFCCFVLVSLIIHSNNSILSRDYDFFTLDNGLDVILIKSDISPIVTIQIAVKNGAYTQTRENCGLSHLYEHMFFKGNEKWRSQEEYSNRVKELGIVYNGMTSNESVRYFFTLPSKLIDEGLEFMHYAIRKPLFDTLELKKEINVVMNEFKRDFSTPDYKFYHGVEREMFFEYFYRKNAIGYKDVILNATREQMIEIQNKFYIPNNCALIIVGDMDFKKSKKLVEKYFADWEKGNNPVFDFPAHPMLEKDKKVFFINENANVAKLYINFRGPDVDKNRDESFACDLLGDYFRLKSSPMYEKLVQTGLVYNYYGGYYTQQDGGMFYFHFTLESLNIDTVSKIVMAEFEKMTNDDYFDNILLQEIKDKNEIEFYYSIESSQRFALNVGSWWCITDLDYFITYLENMRSTTPEQISGIVEKYIHNKPKVSGILTDNKNIFDSNWKEITE